MMVVDTFRLCVLLLLVGNLIFVSSIRDQPPYIRSDHSSYHISVSTGGKAKIDCWVYGSPPLNVTWYKDGNLLQTSSHIKILANHSLIIRSFHLNANHNDGGRYYCIAKNRYGEFTSRVTTINVRYLGTTFKGPEGATVFYKESHSFRCLLPDGYPKPKFIEWRKDGVPLYSSTRPNNVRLVKIGGVNILQIESAERKNAGKYACVARNQEGERISPGALLRVIPRDAPKIAIQSPVKVHLGSMAKIHCADISNDAGSRPMAKRIWSKINDGMPEKSRRSESSEGYLSIKNVKRSDAGKYKCTAVSGHLSSSAYGDLEIYERPYLVIQPTNTSVPLYSDVKFTCKVSKGINPYIYWRHGSVTYRKNQMHFARVQVTENELLIQNVQPADEGTIRCLVDDGGIPITSANVKLTVLRTSLPLPQIDITPDNQTVMEGRRHTITCVGIGDRTLRFEWMHAANGHKIHGKTRGINIKTDQNESNLTFKAIKPKDSGAYRCKVIGAGGTKTLISMVHVTLGVPSKVPYLKVSKIAETAVELSWRKPMIVFTLPITSYVIKTQDQRSGETKASIVGGKYTTSIIRNLRSSATYVFSIAAINTAGKGESVWSSVIHMSGGSPLPLPISVTPVSFDSIKVNWTTKIKGEEITEHILYVRRLGFPKFNMHRLKRRSQYTVKNLQPHTEYQIRLKAINRSKEVAISRYADVKTLLKIKTFAVKKIDNENLMVMWSPPNGFHAIKHAVGYEISCLDFGRFTVNKRAKRYLVSGLDKQETYNITVLVKTKTGTAAISTEISFQLGAMKDREVIGVTPDSSISVPGGKKKENSIQKMLRQPWFIVAAAVLIWLLLMVAVICLVRACKARRKKRYERSMDFNNGLLAGRLDYSNNTLQNLASWKKNDSEVEFKTCPRKAAKVNNCCRGRKRSLDEDFPNRADIKARMSYTRNESVELRPKQPIAYDLVKESNNIVAKKNGYLGDHHLNNEINRNHQPCIVSTGDYPRMLLRRTSQEPPPNYSPRREPRYKSDSAERRHAEILRTAVNKSFPDAKPVNVLEKNPHHPSWKHSVRESPKVKKPSGEDSLRRQQKFKPLPNLEVLNWANGLPTSNSSQSDSVKDGSQFSAASSPKMPPNVILPPRTKTSMDGSITSQTTPDDEKRRRRISNTSSMVSSELYQSELDPSAYSDTASERRRKKERIKPPPIGLEGLTSDILLQWAESVTNSSPSSSESSSPTRLSGVSSDGSIYTDQNFAKAVAAVAECGGFSLGNDTSTPNRFVPHISMSNYLSGLGKLPTEMCTTPPLPRTKTNNKKTSSSLDKNLVRYGTGFQDVDSVSSAAKPLTKSNLNKHNSSLERGNKEVTNPPLTVSNLREHDTSLDRGRRHPTKRPGPTGNHRERVNTVPAKNLQMPEAPLSFTSALERNECLNSKDSLNSSKEDSEVENAGTSERKPKRFR